MKYFTPTPEFKKYLILELISSNSNITQREISEEINVSVSQVNMYLDEYEKLGYIKRNYISKKTVEYLITNLGIEMMRVYNIGYLAETQKLYNKAKKEIMKFINEIINKGYKDIILYGAGEVAEIILQTINNDKSIPLNIVSLIDDDKTKQGRLLGNVLISDISVLNKVKHDAVMISSYTQHMRILNKLREKKYLTEKVEWFFKQVK